MRRSRILLLAVVLPLVIGLIAQPARATEGSGITIYVVPAMTDEKILPTTSISPDYVSSQISIFASPGEFEPASFVVRANGEISALTAAATDLSGANGSIPSSYIDIKLVKCWWQAKPGASKPWQRADAVTRVLMPELLVNDPTFIIADENQQNYIKQTDGSYRWISENVITSVNDNPKTSAMPVKDSATLLPVDIPAGTNQQFWVTIEVPGGSPAGVYRGTINLTTPSGTIGAVAVELEVFPISLQPSMDEHAMFNWWDLVPDASATIGPSKSETQIKAEIKDMYEHGVTIPCITTSNEADMRNILQWCRDAGFTSEKLYYYGLHSLMTVVDSDPTRLATLKSEVQRIIGVAADYGFTDVYIYGVDEAVASKRSAERPNYETVHSAGAKVFICSYTGTYEVVGDLVDVIVWPYDPLSSEATKWHSAGQRILSYANPQSGVEAPETYRRNFGLLLWQRNFDGGLSFAYQWVDGGNLWSDFSGSSYRSEVFAYPTMNGVVDTIEWEGWREGADDMRYLTTLLKTIEEAKAIGKDTSAAESWLAELKSSDLATKDLNTVRSQMVGYILSLSAGSSSDVTPPVITSISHSVITSPLATTTFTWTTDERASSQVEYGKTSQLGLSTTLDSSLVYNHEVTLTGLDTNSTYCFRVKSTDASGNLATSGIQTLSTVSSLSISLIPPTDADKAVVSRNFSQISTSLVTTYEASSFVDWNRSLVGYWDFNGSSGSTAYDKSTYGNNGTLKNGPQWIAGKFGSALKFDGVDDYVDCGSNSSLNTTNTITIEAWVKTSKVGWNTIATKLVNPSNGYWFGTNSSGNLYMFIYNNATSRACPTGAYITDGAWHHVVGTYDGTRTTFYVDGETFYTKDWGSFMAIGGTSGKSVYISSTGSDRFNGLIDEVRIWNRALSPEDVKASYNSNTDGLSLNVGGLANGTYQYYAYATDLTGNSSRTETRTLTVDTGGIPGDVNGDQVVNTADITSLERIIAGLDVPTAGADANQDGKINTADITKVERIVAGLG